MECTTRVPTLCKGEDAMQQQLVLYYVYDNFCLPHASVRQPLPQPEPTNGTGSAKHWRPCTPAMAAGLTDHVWTLREVLLYCDKLSDRSYGRHDCVNIVTEGEGIPSAVLLRAVQPEVGLDVMRRRRGTGRRAALATGPGNLCRAFAIDLGLNGWDLTRGQHLWVAMPASSAALQIVRSRRIGVADDLELRFSVVSP
jgi:Methylpurine-DNA glycosylase (MPG)